MSSPMSIVVGKKRGIGYVWMAGVRGRGRGAMATTPLAKENKAAATSDDGTAFFWPQTTTSVQDNRSLGVKQEDGWMVGRWMNPMVSYLGEAQIVLRSAGTDHEPLPSRW